MPEHSDPPASPERLAMAGRWQAGLRLKRKFLYNELMKMLKADSLFHEWLKLEPDWGWGWIGCSDCYWLWEYLGLEKDLDKAEEILRKGLSVSNVSDRDHIEDRLEYLLKEKNKIQPIIG